MMEKYFASCLKVGTVFDLVVDSWHLDLKEE